MENDGDGIVPSSSTLSTVDRRVVVKLNGVCGADGETKTSTPSSLANVTTDVERIHRLYGSALIRDGCILLETVGKSGVYATACTIFHRFFHAESLTEFDIWPIAGASLLLASKVEEEAEGGHRLRRLILVLNHLYQRRRFQLGYEEKPDDVSKTIVKVPIAVSSCVESYNLQNTEQRETFLRSLQKRSPLSPLSALYGAWKDLVVQGEALVLRRLGFTLYWIPQSHPHRFLLYIVRILLEQPPSEAPPSDPTEKKTTETTPSTTATTEDATTNKLERKIATLAWNYCNESYRLDMCVRFDAQVICCAAIVLACHDARVTLPEEWWKVFLPHQDDSQQLSTVCNALLALRAPENKDLLQIPKVHDAYIVSLIPGGSDLDPGSYIWTCSDRVD